MSDVKLKFHRKLSKKYYSTKETVMSEHVCIKVNYVIDQIQDKHDWVRFYALSHVILSFFALDLIFVDRKSRA